MATLIGYLKAKYAVEVPTTILGVEARVFGIPMPLQGGWLGRHKNTKLTIEMASRLMSILPRIKGENINRDRAISYLVSTGLVSKPMGHIPFIKQVDLANSKKAKQKFRKQQKINACSDRLAASKFIGMDVVADSFLQTYEWRKLRMEALKLHGARCQCCGASPSTGAVMNVDHIKPRKLFPDLSLSLDNLQVLCGECNHGKGNWDQTDWRTTR